MGIFINWGLQNGWFRKILLLNGVIWGYPFFRTPPYINSNHFIVPEVDEDVEAFHPRGDSAESQPKMATTFTEVWKPAPPAQKSAGPTNRWDLRGRGTSC